MKVVARSLVSAILLLAPTCIRAAGVGTQRAAPAPTPPKQLAFSIQLQGHPELDTPDSSWEVSYELRVGDMSEYTQWMTSQEGKPPSAEPGLSLKKDSFRHSNLSREANRRQAITVPVSRELRQLFYGARQAPQAVRLRVRVRVRSAATNLDVFKNDIVAVWDLRYFVKDSGKVILGIAPDRQLRWSSNDPPPWGRGAQDVIKTPRY